MENLNKEDHSGMPVDRKYLYESLEKHGIRMQKYFNAKLDPIIETLDFHDKTLYGKDGSNHGTSLFFWRHRRI